jgi:hypothetical protein
MSTNEVDLGFQYFATQLSSDATLLGYAPGGGYRKQAPAKTLVPYWIAIYMSGTTTTNFGGIRGYVSLLYQVKAVGPDSQTAQIASAAARIDALITTATQITVTGGIIKSCIQQQPIEMDEPVEKEQWTNIGGLYRLMITAT